MQLPDSPRPWGSDDQRIRALIPSVSLATPTGALMLMRANAEAAFRHGEPSAENAIPTAHCAYLLNSWRKAAEI